MNKKKQLSALITGAMTIAMVILVINSTGAVLPTDSIILTMTCEAGLEFLVGDTVNVTVIFKNYLNTTSHLKNATIWFEAPEELNITAVYNLQPTNMTAFNETQYFQDNVNSTTPYFGWDSNSVNVSWAQIDPETVFEFWFTANCTEAGLYGPEPIGLKYYLENELFVDDTYGVSISFDVNEESEIPRYPVPLRGDFVFYWWLIGGMLIALPLAIIIIVRITLWKR